MQSQTFSPAAVSQWNLWVSKLLQWNAANAAIIRPLSLSLSVCLLKYACLFLSVLELYCAFCLLICFARLFKRVTNISLGIYAHFVAVVAVAAAEVPFSPKRGNFVGARLLHNPAR